MNNNFELVGQDDKMEIYRLETEPFGTNTYIVFCSESTDSLLIDAPGNADVIKEKLKHTNLQSILMTHGHMDHVMALEELSSSLDAPLAAHEDDAGMLPVKVNQLLRDGDTIECGRVCLNVIHVPGHTAGSLCFKAGNYLFAGDTLFPGGPGKTAAPQDFKQIISSIKEKLLSLPDETVVLPGHGDSTTIGSERPLIEDFMDRGYDDNICGDVTWR